MRRVTPFGDAAIEVAARDAREARALSGPLAALEGVLEVVVGWDRVLCHLRDDASMDAVIGRAREVEAAKVGISAGASRLHEVRVVYDGSDLAEMSEACALSPEEIARRHAITYDVEVIGFLPGFAYLGPVDASLARPRRSTPRTRVAPLSVGIAATRTAVYPLASPGGWNLVGRAVDCSPFDLSRGALFRVGDRVRFVVEDVCRR